MTKAQRGHGEAYGRGKGFRIRGMSATEAAAAVELAAAVARQGGTIASQVKRLRIRLRK